MAIRLKTKKERKTFWPKPTALNYVKWVLFLLCGAIPLISNLVYHTLPNHSLMGYVSNANAPTYTSRSTTTTSTRTTVHLESGEQTSIPIREVAQLTLQPWENVNHCNPPKNVPPACCLGSSSGGVLVNYDPRSKCVTNKTQEVYDRAETVASEYLAKLPAVKNLCDICQIMDYLFQHNASLAFVGDSVMGQTATSFECELYRRG